MCDGIQILSTYVDGMAYGCCDICIDHSWFWCINRFRTPHLLYADSILI